MGKTTDKMKTINYIRQILSDRREKEKRKKVSVFEGVPNRDIQKIVSS